MNFITYTMLNAGAPRPMSTTAAASSPPPALPVVTIPITIPHPGAAIQAFLSKYGWIVVLLAGMWLNAHGGEALAFARAHLPALPAFAAADLGPAPDPAATDPATVGSTLRDYVEAGYVNGLQAGANASIAGAKPSDVLAAAHDGLLVQMATPANHLGKVLSGKFGDANAPMTATQAAALKSFLEGLAPTLHPARKK